MSDDRQRARVNRADINSLHQRINELHSKIDHAIALLERRPDTRPLGPTRTATGELHLPGTGTLDGRSHAPGADQLGDPEPDPERARAGLAALRESRPARGSLRSEHRTDDRE